MTKRSQLDLLGDLCDHYSFFATADGQPWAQPPARDRLIHVHHPDLRDALASAFESAHGFAPAPAALNAAMATCLAQARCAPDSRIPVPGVRLSATADRSTLAINGGPHQTWEHHADPSNPVTRDDRPFDFMFLQGRGSQPFPKPSPTLEPQALTDLQTHLNLATDDDWTRTLTWLVAAWNPDGPYPILILQGPDGCGKTQAAKALRQLIDPNQAPLLPLPRARKIQPLAAENWVLAFDQVCRISPTVSSTLSGISSGTGYAQPAGKDDYIPVWQARPMIITTTEDCKVPKEIVSRAYVVHLKELTESTRRSDAELDAEFAALHPKILAYLLKANEKAIQARNHPPHFAALPRMADAAVWVANAVDLFGITPTQLLDTLLKPPKLHKKKDPLLPTIQALGDWRGTATDLWNALPPDQKPPTEKELGNRISRMIEHLDEASIEVLRHHTNKKRELEFRKKIKISLSPASKRHNISDPASSPESPAAQRHDPADPALSPESPAAQRHDPSAPALSPESPAAQRHDPADTALSPESPAAQRHDPSDTTLSPESPSAQRHTPADTALSPESPSAQRHTPADTASSPLSPSLNSLNPEPSAEPEDSSTSSTSSNSSNSSTSSTSCHCAPPPPSASLEPLEG